MRIISGKYKGRRFRVNPKVTARPTTDFAKEGLFNLLNNFIDFKDIIVLDLFAGIGSISFEFISRGAEIVHAVEHDYRNIVYMKKVGTKLQEDKLLISKTDVFKYIENCNQQYDLIFADPPYDMEGLDKLPKLILKNKLLKKDGHLVLEHSKNQNFEEYPNFSFMRRYGNVYFSFFNKKADINNL